MTFEVVCSSRYIQMMNPRHGSIEFSLHSEPSPNKAGRGQRPEKVGPPAEARGANGMTGRVLNKADGGRGAICFLVLCFVFMASSCLLSL
jgi:hypothetical protein